MKLRLFCLILSCLFLLTACRTGEEAPADTPEMYIEAAQLTEEEQTLAELLAPDSGYHIYDAVLDERVQSVEIATYELIGGEWKPITSGGYSFADSEARFALDFDKLPQGMRTAIQSEHNGSSDAYAPSDVPELSGMSIATATLTDRTGIVYEQEIPLVVQIITDKTELVSSLDSFFTPETLAQRGYEHVYAVTIRFSEKTLAEQETAP